MFNIRVHLYIFKEVNQCKYLYERTKHVMEKIYVAHFHKPTLTLTFENIDRFIQILTYITLNTLIFVLGSIVATIIKMNYIKMMKDARL